jgi:hypothetical protein
MPPAGLDSSIGMAASRDPASSAQVAALGVASRRARMAEKGWFRSLPWPRSGRISDPRRPFSRARAAKAGIGRMEAGCRPAHPGSRHRAGRVGPGQVGRQGEGRPVCLLPGRSGQRPQAVGRGSSRSGPGRRRGRGQPGAGAALPAVGSVFAPRKKVCRASVLLGQQAPRRPSAKYLGRRSRARATAIRPGRDRTAAACLGIAGHVQRRQGVMARVGYLPVSLRNSSALWAGDSASIAASRSAIASDFAALGSAIAGFPGESWGRSVPSRDRAWRRSGAVPMGGGADAQLVAPILSFADLVRASWGYSSGIAVGCPSVTNTSSLRSVRGSYSPGV